MRYFVLCLDDSTVYGDRDTIEQAELRAKVLAEKNIGRVYVVLEAKSSFQLKPKDVEMVILDYQE
jgi:hypothetical protein